MPRRREGGGGGDRLGARQCTGLARAWGPRTVLGPVAEGPEEVPGLGGAGACLGPGHSGPLTGWGLSCSIPWLQAWAAPGS